MIHKAKFLLVTWCLCVLVTFSFSLAYALNLEKLKVHFLSGDYSGAISEGEKILATSSHSSAGLDELYYILALSYTKEGNYLRASDIFEIILKEFKESDFTDEAKLGLGDTYFLKGDYDKAQSYYTELITVNPRTKLKAQAYYRLRQAALKRGDTALGKEYSDKLKVEFPAAIETNLNKDLYTSSDIVYTVQVGSFVNHANARNLSNKLIAKGYDAYLEESGSGSLKTYRVRVGKLKSRDEAARIENKLSSEGYPTKIIP